MTPEQHPGPDELILYSMGTPATTAADRDSMDRVRLHVKECPECHAQMVAMRTDMALVAMAIPQIPPPIGAKERLFQAAGLDMERAAKSNPPVNVVPMKPQRANPILVWGGWIAAAACLLYAVQIRESNQGIRQQLRMQTAQIVQSSESSARARQVLDLMSSPHAQRVTLVAAHATPVPTGHAVYLANHGALVFTASNLAPLPVNKTYELWVIPANGTAPVPAGTFQPDARGMASVLLPSLPSGIQAKAFGVTMENSGGSATPTLPILLAGG